jgi:hypothetical protein
MERIAAAGGKIPVSWGEVIVQIDYSSREEGRSPRTDIQMAMYIQYF